MSQYAQHFLIRTRSTSLLLCPIVPMLLPLTARLRTSCRQSAHLLFRHSPRRNFANTQPHTISSIISTVRQPQWENKIAITDVELSKSVTYRQLDEYSTILAQQILLSEEQRGIASQHKAIASFHKPGLTFTLAMLASWKLNRTFVPLCATHSLNEVSYVVSDSRVGSLICHKHQDIHSDVHQHYAPHIIEDASIKYNVTSSNALASIEERIQSARFAQNEDALIIYTSGTTGRPKGVVHTHHGLQHMIESVTQAWEYNSSDKILHFLPLYHVHGLLNKLLCVLCVGGSVEFLPSAHAADLWTRLAREQTDAACKASPVTMFMAVPTVYAKMLEHAKSATLCAETRARAIRTMQALRLMVSGSAALPDVVMDAWQALTGQVLLERYGMTEIGMALTNPYAPVCARRKGFVGAPFPHVQARLVDPETGGVVIVAPQTPGELQIAGPGVFKEYLNRPEATAESFDTTTTTTTVTRWFKTGDIAERDVDGSFKLLGRASADIIKSSGFKISALEIERELLSHPAVLEVAVCAAPDAMLGESIVAVLVLRDTSQTTTTTTTTTTTPTTTAIAEEMTRFLSDRLAKYKQPRRYLVVPRIPRNHMGKVNKKTLLRDVDT